MTHAHKSVAHFFRPDNTTIHTFYFDVETGAPRFGQTDQGARDNSCQARGQAWAIYGFALIYRYTREAAFLECASRTADYFLAPPACPPRGLLGLGLHQRRVWSGRGGRQLIRGDRGLLELAGWLPTGAKAATYRAEAMVQSLYEGYYTKDNPASNAQILHGVYSKLAGHGVDEANLWVRHCYVEALLHLACSDWEAYW